MGSAMIDVDNDGVDEVFIAGGVKQNDCVFKYDGERFVDVSKTVKMPVKSGEYTTFGAVSFDLDKNGFNDLILSGDNGLTWLKNDGGKFSTQKIEVPLNEKSTAATITIGCLLYTSPSPRDATLSRMPSSA